MTPPKVLANEAKYQKAKHGPLYAMGGAHPNALARNDNAMKGLATGAKGNEREQDIHTPACVLAVARTTFGEISLDPCASNTRVSFAHVNWFDSGTCHDWPIGTFYNPPYKNLKDWLEHAAEQPEHIGLYPVRPNREWWVGYHSAEAGIVKAIAWLKPLKFEGFTQAFPAPLVLVYSGHRVIEFKAAVLASQLAHMISGPLSEV